MSRYITFFPNGEHRDRTGAVTGVGNYTCGVNHPVIWFKGVHHPDKTEKGALWLRISEEDVPSELLLRLSQLL